MCPAGRIWNGRSGAGFSTSTTSRSCSATVAEPRYESARQRVTGVLLDPADGLDEEPEFVAADLVVDAAGRGTRLPVWLTQWGYQRPPEATVDIGINYATQQFRMPEGLIAEKVVVAGASHDQSLGLGMLYYEDGIWVLTTFGVANAKPPRTFPEMLALAERNAAGPLQRGAGTGRARRGACLSRFPGQQMAPLPQAGALPGRDRAAR